VLPLVEEGGNAGEIALMVPARALHLGALPTQGEPQGLSVDVEEVHLDERVAEVRAPLMQGPRAFRVSRAAIAFRNDTLSAPRAIAERTYALRAGTEWLD
jgi:hypothetical protein